MFEVDGRMEVDGDAGSRWERAPPIELPVPTPLRALATFWDSVESAFSKTRTRSFNSLFSRSISTVCEVVPIAGTCARPRDDVWGVVNDVLVAAC
jgi:hypothetical protein